MALLVKLCALLMMICFINEAIVLSTAQQTSLNPLAPYVALMPGKPIDALQDYPCQFRTIPETTMALGACQFPQGYRVFSKIALTAVDHMTTQMSAYDIQPDALHLDDLMLCWGELNTIINYQSDGSRILDLYRKGQMYGEVTSVQFSQRMDYFLPANHLTFYLDWQPCGLRE